MSKSHRFYSQVIGKLLPDIILMQSRGLPVDRQKVSELSVYFDNIVEITTDRLLRNPLIQDFVKIVQKIPEYRSTTTHKSYLINEWLKDIGHSDKVLKEWNKEDTELIEALVGKIPFSDKTLQRKAMTRLAEDKRAILAKKAFNPCSAKQVREFFESQGIFLEKYDREHLEKLMEELDE